MVSADQFRKWVNHRYSWNTSDAELKALAAAYGVPGRPGLLDLGKFKDALGNRGGREGRASAAKHAARMRGEELASGGRPSTVGATNELNRRRWSLREMLGQLKERIQMKSRGGGRYQDAFRLFYGTQIGNENNRRTVMTKEQLHRSLQVPHYPEHHTTRARTRTS